MLKFDETRDRLVITDVPTFPLVVLGIVCLCFTPAVFMADSPWYIRVVFGGVVIGKLVSATFWSHTTIDGTSGQVENRRLTMFGFREKRLTRRDLVDLAIYGRRWGSAPSSASTRYGLQVQGCNDLLSIVEPSGSLEVVQQIEAKVRRLLALSPVSESPVEPLEAADASVQHQVREIVAAWMPREGFIAWNDLPEEHRLSLVDKLCLDLTVDPILYGDPSMFSARERGLVIGVNGIYWLNDLSLDEFTRRSRLSWAELKHRTATPDEEDERDLLFGDGVQLSLGGPIKRKDVTDLLERLQRTS